MNKNNSFKRIQKRRSQTEARISIFRNYCGSRQLQRGFDHRIHHVGLSVLSHNLDVLCRIKILQLKEKALEKANDFYGRCIYLLKNDFDMLYF